VALFVLGNRFAPVNGYSTKGLQPLSPLPPGGQLI